MAPLNIMDMDVDMDAPLPKAAHIQSSAHTNREDAGKEDLTSRSDGFDFDGSVIGGLSLLGPPKAPRAAFHSQAAAASNVRAIRKVTAPSDRYNRDLDRKREHHLQNARSARQYDTCDLRKQHSTYSENVTDDFHPDREETIHQTMSYYHGGGGGRRNDYNGGGGGGGRKRRFRDDDEFDQRGPPMRKRHMDEPASRRLKNMVLNIGDIPMRDPESVVAEAARLLADNSSDEYLRGFAGELFTRFILEQPLKIPFAAAILVQLASLKLDYAQDIADKIGKELQIKLDQGEWRDVKLLLRYFGLAHGVFEGDAVFGLLDELFNRAVDLQAGSSEDVLGLELVKIIMLTIPYILAWNVEHRSRADELLEKTAVVASTSHEVERAVVPYVELDGDAAENGQGILSMLHQQLQNEASSGFSLPFILRFTPPRQQSNDGANGDGVPRINFPEIVIPEVVKAAQPVFPDVWMSVYADQEVESVPRTSNIASTLLRDAMIDTVDILDFNRVQTAQFLINMESYFAPDTFAKRATPFEKVRSAPEGEPTWKSEDVLIDAIFSQLLRLPTPVHKTVYYHSVITEACRFAPAAIAPSLGRAIRYLYRAVHKLDVELMYRFMDWFAHHLSNFDFRWKWIEWNDDVALSPLIARKSFMLGSLDKEIRLSFAKRIRETLPTPYHRLIPAARDNEKPEFKFDPALNHPFSAQGIEILQLLRKKAPDEDFDAAIENIHRLAVEQNPTITDAVCVSTDVFVTALCQIGFKSLSHVLAFIERNRARLINLTSRSADARQQIVTSVVEYWVKHQPGLAVNIIDKLLNYSVVSPADVVGWALASPDRLQGGVILASHWVFEMVSVTLSKVCRRVRQIAEARNTVGLSEEQAAEMEEALSSERESLKQLFTSVDDALSSVATGATDAQIDAQDVDLSVLGLGPAARTEGNLDETDGDGNNLPSAEGAAGGGAEGDDPALRFDERLEGEELVRVLRLWGEKWQRVFRRKLAVEEVHVEAVKGNWPVPGLLPDANGDAEGDGDGEERNGRGGGEGVDGDGEVDAP